MGGARETRRGVYWTPEKISWLWYNDTTEKHAFILKTLQNMRPKTGGSRAWPMADIQPQGKTSGNPRGFGHGRLCLLDVLKSGAPWTRRPVRDPWETWRTRFPSTSDWLENHRWTKQGLTSRRKSTMQASRKRGRGSRSLRCVHLFHGQDPGGFRRRDDECGP